MGHRYTLPGIKEMDGTLVENAYRGTRYLDEVESLAADVACRVFNSEHACVRPLSGHISALIALTSVCRRGDRIMAVDFADGGYPGYGNDEMAGMLGLDSHPLPFSEEECEIDYDAASDSIAKVRPRVVVVGASKMLFPPEIGRLREACDKVGSRLIYDASHVLGLIAGGRFGDPLKDGAEMVYGSTHKTLFGPQGGIILTNDQQMFGSVEGNLHWTTIDNAHWNRIACLAQALLEMESFGREYARQVVSNARHLARVLDRGGMPIQCGHRGYTESHQVGLDSGQVARSLGVAAFEEAAKKLESADIIIDCVGRLGTCEITRLGMGEREVEEIAGLMARVLFEGEALSSVKEAVHQFRARYQKVAYSFD
jgi:glycine hydroxymethyltransferase